MEGTSRAIEIDVTYACGHTMKVTTFGGDDEAEKARKWSKTMDCGNLECEMKRRKPQR